MTPPSHFLERAMGVEPFDSSALRTRSWPRADESNGLSERSESNGPPTVAHRDPHEFWTHEAREKFDVAARSSEGLSPPNPPLHIPPGRGFNPPN